MRTLIEAAPDELVVTVTDDGRGMQPRADSPGLGLGLPTIASLTTRDGHARAARRRDRGGDDLRRAGRARARRAARRARRSCWTQVARTVDGTWPGEGVERLVDLLVPELADACALDVLDASGRPQRFAGRIDGPDGAAPVGLAGGAASPRTDSPQSAARQALDDGGLHVAELTREHIARITASQQDAEQMAATGIQLVDGDPDGRRRPPRRPAALRHAAAAAARRRRRCSSSCAPSPTARRSALVTTQLISDLRRTRRRFERILDVLGEAVTVQDAAGRMVYANDGRGAAGRLRNAGGAAGHAGRRSSPRASRSRAPTARRWRSRTCPSSRLLAGLDAPPLLTRSVHRASGRELWLLTKATLLDDGGERLAVNIIEDVTGSR